MGRAELRQIGGGSLGCRQPRCHRYQSGTICEQAAATSPAFRDMPNVKRPSEWNALVDFLTTAEDAGEAEIKRVFGLCLRSIAKRLEQQTFRYQIPARVSPAQFETILEEFLSTPSGGFRPLAIMTAAMRTFGHAFSIFSRVEAQGINEADAATGAPGDILCFDDVHETPTLVVEVKDHAISVSELRASTTKVQQSTAPLTRLLLAAPGLRVTDRDEIDARIHQSWAAGLNVYHVDILALLRTCLVLFGRALARSTLTGDRQ